MLATYVKLIWIWLVDIGIKSNEKNVLTELFFSVVEAFRLSNQIEFPRGKNKARLNNYVIYRKALKYTARFL